MVPALAITGLSKNFGSVAVTRNLSLSLYPGDRHALIGPNGAGKTTLINQITGVLRSSAGSIRLRDRDITRMAPERRVAHGLVRTFQINSLFNGLTVAENIALAVSARRGMDSRPWGRINSDPRIVEEANAQLARLDLLALAHCRVSDLAYGQRRLIEIALALALDPKVLLLDEPMAGVSARDSQMLLNVLLRLPEDIAVLVIEHDMDVVFRFAKRISVLVQGEILTEGSPAEIQNDARVRDIYLGRGTHG